MRQSEIIKELNKHKTVYSMGKAMCGKFLGGGMFRDVFVLKQDERWVVKVEKNIANGAFANATEWRNWINHKEFKRFSKYLAPCLTIDSTSLVLIQRRVQRKDDGDARKFPVQIPNWFTDTKRGNFGWIGDQFVCFDYSFLLQKDFKMKKAKWW